MRTRSKNEEDLGVTSHLQDFSGDSIERRFLQSSRPAVLQLTTTTTSHNNQENV